MVRMQHRNHFERQITKDQDEENTVPINKDNSNSSLQIGLNESSTIRLIRYDEVESDPGVSSTFSKICSFEAYVAQSKIIHKQSEDIKLLMAKVEDLSRKVENK